MRYRKVETGICCHCCKPPPHKQYTKRIGATTYVVNVHFAETDSATAEDRLLHLIRNDIRVMSCR